MDATRTTPLRERMRQELQLAGLSERTQEAYLRSVRQLATHFGKPPDQITEPELRQYLLYLKNEKHLAPASFKIAFYGIRFFFRTTVPRDWPTPWWLAALGAADGAAAAISAAEPPRGDAFERTKPSSSARSRHRLRPS